MATIEQVEEKLAEVLRRRAEVEQVWKAKLEAVIAADSELSTLQQQVEQIQAQVTELVDQGKALVMDAYKRDTSVRSIGAWKAFQVAVGLKCDWADSEKLFHSLMRATEQDSALRARLFKKVIDFKTAELAAFVQEFGKLHRRDGWKINGVTVEGFRVERATETVRFMADNVFKALGLK